MGTLGFRIPPLLFSRVPSSLRYRKMNTVARVSNTVRVMSTRKMGTGRIQPGYEKIKAKQEFYQVPNGLLIHEKSAFDRGLYYTTAFLTVAGVVMSLKFFYDSSYPKKA